MSDLISREAALKVACDTCQFVSCPDDDKCDEYEAMKNLPSAEPPWIPCSERLPKQGQEVICQCRASIIKVLKLDADGDWYEDANHCYMGGFVVAWMPMPEPYREDGE